MTVIRWILSVLFALPVLLNLTTLFDGEWLINAILLAIATALVLPPLDPTFAEKLAALKSKTLRIFLAVVLAIAGLVIGLTPALSLNNIAVCSPATVSSCESELTLFAAGVQPVTVQTLLDEDSANEIASIEVNISKDNNAGENFNIVNQTVEVDGTTAQTDVKLEELALDVGVYEVEVTPLGTEEQTGLSKKATFVVLPSEEDVTKRTSSDNSFGNFKQTISELLVCPDPGGEDHCEDMQTTIPSSTPVLADAIMRDADANYTWLGKGPEITFTWRAYTDDESSIPEIVLQDTIDLGSNTGVFGYPLGIDDGGLPPGEYDVIAVLETINSQPLQIPFTVTE